MLTRSNRPPEKAPLEPDSLAPLAAAVLPLTVSSAPDHREPGGAVPTEGDFPLVYTANGVKRRKIMGHDLSQYEKPLIPGNRNFAWRAAWYLVNAFFFQGAILSLIPGSWKAAILRAFGAKVGTGFVCKPRVTIKYPWSLKIGDYVWLGEGAWLDNHTTVDIGNNVCISQGAYIFTGNHDRNDKRLGFHCRSVSIGSGSWVGAASMVPPGTMLPPGTIIEAGLRGIKANRETKIPPMVRNTL